MRLIELRKSKGWSQEELGDRVGASRQTISKWELGQTKPEMSKLITLTKIYNISLDELVSGKTRVEININNNQKGYYEYKSKRRLFNIPIIHIKVGNGFHRSKGIISIGNIAIGVISLGGFSFGILSLGGLSLGLLSLGGLSLGGISVGGLSFGLLSIGGLAFGLYSIGGVAISRNIALGEIARGKVRFLTNNINDLSSEDVRNNIYRSLPKTNKIIVDLFIKIIGINK